MKSVVLTGIENIAVKDIPKPELKGKKDVLLRMRAAGICGSDMHYYKEGKIGNKIVEFPFVVGHEGSAIVEKTGDEVTQVRPGDHVVFDPQISCGHCSQCTGGREHTCLQQKFIGCPGQLSGCLTEYIVLPEACCFPIQQSLPLEEAVIIEPLSIGIYSTKFIENLSEKTIGILGSGPIGLCTLVACKAFRAKRIFMTDKIDERLNMALQLSADWTGNPDARDITKDIMDKEPPGLDVVIECCGDQSALDQAITFLKPGGMLLIVGIPESRRISFDIHALRRKEICVQNVRRQNNCIREAITIFEKQGHELKRLITHCFSMGDAKIAFDLVKGYKDGVIKAVIRL